MQFLAGFFIALLVAYTAYRVHSLSRSGAWAAVVVGAIIFGIGGWQWAILLLTFFISSSALTRAFKGRKSGLNEKFSKGGQRDAGQVLGNGALATLFAALHFLYPVAPWVWMAFAASLAAVNADTWATELGVLDPRPPRRIVNPLQVVEKGTSGGVSLTGTLVALAGSCLIGALAVAFSPQPVPWTMGLLVGLAGWLGSLFDSFLGATFQAIYYCPRCEKETEQHPLHTCGILTTHKRGWRWLDNDWVNFGCGMFAVLVVLLF